MEAIVFAKDQGLKSDKDTFTSYMDYNEAGELINVYIFHKPVTLTDAEVMIRNYQISCDGNTPGGIVQFTN